MKFFLQAPVFDAAWGSKEEVSDSTIIKTTEAAKTIKPALVKSSIKGSELSFCIVNFISVALTLSKNLFLQVNKQDSRLDVTVSIAIATYLSNLTRRLPIQFFFLSLS